MIKKNDNIEIKKNTPETEKDVKEKAKCEYKEQLCKLASKYSKLSTKYCPQIKKFIQENYKSTKFIAVIFVLVFATFLLNFNYESNVKLHFSKLGIVKEVTKNGKSSYYLCQNDMSKYNKNSKKVYIDCDTQVIEN
jgi:hypothetical protein